MNISFHVVNKEIYEITVGKKDCYEKALRGIRLLRKKHPTLKIVINSTCVKGLNFSNKELINIINFAKEINASIKFVELFPPKSDGYINLNCVAKAITKLGFKKTNTETRKFNYSDGHVKVSLTRIFCASAMKNENPGEFCNQHNDLFISPDGQIKPCRNNPFEINILQEIKNKEENLLREKIQKSFELLGKKCNNYIYKQTF